jgi:hypothetical protein
LGPLRPRFMRSQCNAPTVQVFPTRAGTDTSPRHLVCIKLKTTAPIPTNAVQWLVERARRKTKLCSAGDVGVALR